MDLQAYLTGKRRIVDAALDSHLPPPDEYPEIIYRAMRYSVLDGGKRLRPILVLAGCEAVGGDERCAIPTACALELVHAYSLIHDDLPAMDNDDFRRGKPTSHKVFGEAIAILTGDALLSYAFEIMTTRTPDIPAHVLLDVAHRVAVGAGTGGMIIGQVVDMISEGKRIEPGTLDFLHAHKTGALIETSVVCGGLLGGATPEQVDALTHYGGKIGLAFQITDDILDIVGDQEKLGKPVGSDLREEKSTYPSLYGLEKSKQLAQEAVDGAIRALDPFDERADPLRSLARFILEREA